MYVRISRLKKVVAEQAAHLFEQMKEDVDRLRRGAPGEYGGESHTGFEEALELEDFELEAKKKDEADSDDEGAEDKPKEKPAFLKGKGKDEPKKKSPPKEEPEEVEDSGEEEDSESKKEPSPKHKKVKKGLEKAQKQKKMPKSQVDPATGVKQDVDLDALAQLATEAGYRLEKMEPEEPDPDDDFGLSDLDGEEDFGLGIDPSFDDDKFPGDADEMDFDDKHGKDIEDEDVALFSSDETIGDVMGMGHKEEDESDFEGHPLSMKRSLPVAKQGSAKQGGLKLRINK